ncbi:MAG: hypothetical protein Q4D76_18615, partial [Oscillospiraceae bacterium]|nr:hypothetical protein [Oscillospiraceae bacterium]
QTYSLYYHVSSCGVIVTNSYCHIALVCGSQINEAPLLEKGVRRCILSNETPFKDVYKLCSNESITINTETKECAVNKLELNDYRCKFENKKDAINALYEVLDNTSSIRSKYINNVFHFLTGGIDSRLELAIHMHNNDNISLGYWKGKNLLTNGTEEDAEIVRKISTDFNLKYERFDVSEEFKRSICSIDTERVGKYGEFASIYGGNNKLFDIFSRISDKQLVGFGYLGETIRTLSELDASYRNGYKLDDFIREVYCRTGLEKEIFCLEGFYDYLEKHMKRLINCSQLDSDELNKDVAFKLFSISRFEADCIMSNFANLYSYSFPIFGQKKIADIISSFKYEWLKGDEVPVRLIEMFKKELLDYPIYSHHRSFAYNKKNSQLQKSMKYRTLDFLKHKFKDTFIYKTIYLKYAHNIIRPQTSGNDEIAKECINIVKELGVLKNSKIQIKDNSWNGVDIGTIATFTADLKILNCILMESEKNV